jgi:hypothetical protein
MLVFIVLLATYAMTKFKKFNTNDNTCAKIDEECTEKPCCKHLSCEGKYNDKKGEFSQYCS